MVRGHQAQPNAVNMNASRVRTLLWCFLGFAFLAVLFGHYAFVTRKCLAYPWWAEQLSDGDGMFVTQSLALLNNGDLTFVGHPGGTVLGTHAAFYRFLALFAKPYGALAHMADLPGPSIVFSLLDMAMRASRVLTYLVFLTAFLMFWALLFRLTRSRPLAYFLAAFCVTTPIMLYPLLAIRPELFTFIFCIAALLVVLRSRPLGESLSAEIGWGVLTGIFTGLAVFAKIQVLPQLFLVFVLWLFFIDDPRGAARSKKTAIAAVCVALCNFLIMPWNWLKRPELLTDAYMRHFYPG